MCIIYEDLLAFQITFINALIKLHTSSSGEPVPGVISGRGSVPVSCCAVDSGYNKDCIVVFNDGVVTADKTNDRRRVHGFEKVLQLGKCQSI